VREPTVMEDHRALTLFSTKLFVAIDAIDGKLIWARRKQSPRIMRASAVRHFLAAFFRCWKGGGGRCLRGRPDPE
jgi:DNA topoisomerase IB